MALVPKFFQSKHGTITTICERGLEKFENLQWKGRILIPQNVVKHKLAMQLQPLGFKTNLFKDILFSHEFLSFSVGFVDHDFQNILPTVGDVYHKEH